NLFLIGTINTDETTHTISDKVLDRAVVMDMPKVSASGFLKKLAEKEPGLAKSVDECSTVLMKLEATLSPHGLGFGYRVIEEFVRYHACAVETGCLPSDAAIDYQVSDKILVKLRGTEKQREMLNQLKAILSLYKTASGAVGSLIDQLNENQAFQ